MNVSPAQFRGPAFEASVLETLLRTQFPAGRLELEITEGYLVENPQTAAAAIQTLKNIGISIALDDFGTGYSSVGYLRQFAFDRIKIDRSLAGRVNVDPQAAAVVSGTVGIAAALNLVVTAEGVETDEQAKLLNLAGCDSLQGYYFCRPQSLNALLSAFRPAETESCGMITPTRDGSLVGGRIITSPGALSLAG